MTKPVPAFAEPCLISLSVSFAWASVCQRHSNRFFVENVTSVARETDSIIMLQDGILAGFSPDFKSIQKDCDRYSDELVKMIEVQAVETQDYIQLSGKGALWVTYQYIEQGLLDLVEAHVRRQVTSRDFYGPLFENTHSTLARLIECSEDERVYNLYCAAIEHRLEALKAEAAIRDRPKSDSQARTSSAKWIAAVLPAVKKMTQDYEAILARKTRVDPKLLVFQQSLQEIENP